MELLQLIKRLTRELSCFNTKMEVEVYIKRDDLLYKITDIKYDGANNIIVIDAEFK